MKLARDICSSYDWIDSYSVDGAIQSVLSHNDEPTSLQATSLVSAKEHIDLTHDRITQDIDSLEHALALLHTRRRALKSLSVRHAGALSTFRRLPNEVLLEIFLHACGDDKFEVACLEEGPWNLRAVCRKWASIVEECSQLWCNIVIDVGYDDLDPAAFSRALQFCGSRPIHMKLSMNNLDEDLGDLHADLDTIVSSSQRWGTLSIESNEDLFYLVQELFPLLERNLPLLRTLNLGTVKYWKSDWPSSTAMLTALLSAPMLENVHMKLPDSVLFGRLLDILLIPCHQIRQLSCTVSNHDPAAPRGPLFLTKDKFPLLKRYALTSYDYRAHSSLDHVPAADRHQQDGVTHVATSMIDILNAFSFPALRTFSLGDPDGRLIGPFFTYKQSDVLFKSASHMLSASRCSLVSLTLPYRVTLTDKFLPLLDIVPTLEILDMRVAWSQGTARDEVLCQFFTALGKRRSNSMFSLLPALQDLRLEIAAQSWISHTRSHDLDRNLGHNFCFISQVFEAITERSNYPSDFRVLALTMLTGDSSRWSLSDSDIVQLRAHELIEFSTDAELHSESSDDN